MLLLIDLEISQVLDGHVFTMFVIVLAAAEAAVALAIIINLFKNMGTVNVDEATGDERIMNTIDFRLISFLFLTSSIIYYFNIFW